VLVGVKIDDIEKADNDDSENHGDHGYGDFEECLHQWGVLPGQSEESGIHIRPELLARCCNKTMNL
jgi:hypothetical protein